MGDGPFGMHTCMCLIFQLKLIPRLDRRIGGRNESFVRMDHMGFISTMTSRASVQNNWGEPERAPH